MNLKIGLLPQEKRDRDKLCAAEWGKKLTTEQFFMREDRLRSTRWAQDHMTLWLLEDKDGKILASCETFEQPTRLCFKDRHYRHLREGSALAIASVFTEPSLRGKGYASALLSRLENHIRTNRPDVECLTLYSDVGHAIYNRIGYQPKPAFQYLLDSSEGDPTQGVYILKEGNLLSHYSKIPSAGELLIDPTESMLDWHLERERVYAECLQRPICSFFGASLGESFIIWRANHKDDELVILVFDADSTKNAQILLQSARRMARQVGLKKVLIWEDLPYESPSSCNKHEAVKQLGGTRVARDASLPMILPIQTDVNPQMWNYIPKALWV